MSENSKKNNSLSESFSTVKVPETKSFWKKFFAFAGPGLLISVGYMDPGNWATDLEGGSRFGYTLLSVILLSNIFAIILQHLSLKLGVATELDLAQACRKNYNKTTNFILWILCEIAIAACDLAEVIGSAVALNLLFGLPLTAGIIITTLDVFLILLLQKKGFRKIEIFVAALIFIIFCCFVFEIIASRPEFFSIVENLIPKKEIILNPEMLLIATGILGATVMPHNLYLHSSIIQTRNYPRTDAGKKDAIKFGTLDSTISLFLAFFINAAILILAAAAFHSHGQNNVGDIKDAYHLLSPVLGNSLAGIVFAVALLASGQNSTLTGTLAGQIVMEGFLDIKLKPWLRRLITRLVAVIPALIVAIWFGEKGTNKLLILSQVILSMQLSFAVVPLIIFTGSKKIMGNFANKLWLKILVWIISIIIILLNLFLLYRFFFC